MPHVWLDVTDFVEFLTRRESVSGVQRVIGGVAPLLQESEYAIRPVFLDRDRGLFIELTCSECSQVFDREKREPRSVEEQFSLSQTAEGILFRGRSAHPVEWGEDDVVLFLGAVWIHDGLMMAARRIHARGVRLIFLIYDLTPVLDAEHTPTVRRLFQRYLALVMQSASRAPAISHSSRGDLGRYAREKALEPPEGASTGLPHGFIGKWYQDSDSPWSRPYVLFVGTIEGRKRHMLAFSAWQRLIEERGSALVPDLVCVGRLGWNAEEFLTRYIRTNGLDGKVSVLATGVTDDELARFYAHAEFTIYPSCYEGWGLPVSESLAFGKVVIAARNSSLPEAGGDLARYFETDDLESFLEELRSKGLDLEQRAALEQRIRNQFVSTTWTDVAKILEQEIEMALSGPRKASPFPLVQLGHEYLLASGSTGPPDSAHGDQVMEYLRTAERTPLLQQEFRSDDYLVSDAAFIGDFGIPQTWGLELHPGRQAEFRCTRPVDGELLLLLATRAAPGVVQVEAVGQGGPSFIEVPLGGVLTLNLGPGNAGEPTHTIFTVTDAEDSIEGFLGLRSFLVLSSADEQSQIISYQAAARALRQELDFMKNTRSWRITAPLRRVGGRRPVTRQ